MPEHLSFSQELCISMEQRILHDAELIQGGARIGDYGRLAVTQSQLEQFQKHRQLNYSLPPVTYEEVSSTVGSNEWLSDPAIEIPNVPTVINNKFRLLGIQTVGDIFIIGKQRVSEIDSVGPKSFQALEQALADNYPLIDWEEAPSFESITKLTSDLFQIPVLVLSRKNLLTAAVDLDSPPVLKTYRVGNILSTDLKLMQQNHKFFFGSVDPDKLNKAALEFASRYYAARQKLK